MSFPKTSRAAVVATYGEPIEIRELPVPREEELEPNALLVRVDVASICGSDVHQWDGLVQALVPASLPIILGHEPVGGAPRDERARARGQRGVYVPGGDP